MYILNGGCLRFFILLYGAETEKSSGSVGGVLAVWWRTGSWSSPCYQSWDLGTTYGSHATSPHQAKLLLTDTVQACRRSINCEYFHELQDCDRRSPKDTQSSWLCRSSNEPAPPPADYMTSNILKLKILNKISGKVPNLSRLRKVSRCRFVWRS